MSTAHIPLLSQGTNGDLIQFSDSAEDYLAYRMGLHLASMSHDSDASRLNITAGDSASHPLAIGTYTNTKFNEAVGSHAGFTTATNTVTMYQVNGTVAQTGGDYFRPIGFADGHADHRIEEMKDSDLTVLTDRLLTKAFTGDYPGTYKIASSAPSAQYSVADSDIFTDTRADGTSVGYDLYVRTAMSAPTTKKPFRIVRDPEDRKSVV